MTARRPNHIFILQGPDLPNLGRDVDELRVAEAEPPAGGQKRDRTRVTYLSPDIDLSSRVSQLHVQMMAAIERGEIPAVMIDMHGIPSGRSDTPGAHKMQVGRNGFVETNRMIETILQTYERTFRETHPGMPVPPLRLAVTPCFGESIWRDIKPEILARLDLTLGDSQSRVTRAGDEKVTLRTLARDESTEQRFVRTLSTLAPIVYNPMLISAGLMKDGQPVVLDSDAMRRRVTAANLEQLRALALQRADLIPADLREGTLKRIQELKATDLQNIEHAQTAALVGYLGDQDNRYTPLATYQAPLDTIRRFLDLKTKPEELPALLRQIADRNVLESLPTMIHMGYQGKTKAYLEARYKALTDHGVNIFSGAMVMSGMYAGIENSALQIALSVARHNLDAPDLSGDAALYQAANSGNIPAVRALLKAGANPNLAGSRGFTPLHRAIERGQPELVKLLMEQAALDPNLRGGKDDLSPLELAMHIGNTQVINLLMQDRRISLDSPHPAGVSLLQRAIEGGSPEAVKMLLSLQHPTINPAARDKEGFSMLEIAIHSNNPDIMAALLAEKSVDPTQPDKDGNPIAFSAVYSNKPKALAALLRDPRIDVAQLDMNGNTLLTAAFAVDKATPELITTLLKDGRIDPNQPNLNGETPLHVAIGVGKPEMLAALLANPRVNPNLPDKDGTTPLQAAIDSGKVELVKQLLQRRDLDLSVRDKEGFSMLERAVSENNPEIIRALLADGRVDPNQRGKDGRTPLHLAVSWDKPEAARALLQDRRVDPTRFDASGYTAAHVAVIANRPEVLTELLKHPKVTSTLPDGAGDTLLAIAMRTKNDTLQPVLKAAVEEQKDKDDLARDAGGVVDDRKRSQGQGR